MVVGEVSRVTYPKRINMNDSNAPWIGNSYLVGGPLHDRFEDIPLTLEWVMLPVSTGGPADLLYRDSKVWTKIGETKYRVFIFQEIDPC